MKRKPIRRRDRHRRQAHRLRADRAPALVSQPIRTLLPPHEVAPMLAQSPQVVYSWLRAGVFGPEGGIWFRAGRSIWFKGPALRSWLENRHDGAAPAAMTEEVRSR